MKIHSVQKLSFFNALWILLYSLCFSLARSNENAKSINTPVPDGEPETNLVILSRIGRLEEDIQIIKDLIGDLKNLQSTQEIKLALGEQVADIKLIKTQTLEISKVSELIEKQTAQFNSIENRISEMTTKLQKIDLGQEKQIAILAAVGEKDDLNISFHIKRNEAALSQEAEKLNLIKSQSTEITGIKSRVEDIKCAVIEQTKINKDQAVALKSIRDDISNIHVAMKKNEAAQGKVAEELKIIKLHSSEVHWIKNRFALLIASVRAERTEALAALIADFNKPASERTIVSSSGRMACKPVPISGSCSGLQSLGNITTGVHNIYPHGENGKSVQAFCDMDKKGGGWTVIQRRGEPLLPNEVRENFYRNWTEYQQGFGSTDADYWLGLENIHALVKQAPQELMIELTNWDEETRYAKYGRFEISDAGDFYRLTIGNYSGNANDAMAYNNNHRFSTFNKDNDFYNKSCAEYFVGAWWYDLCTWSNLNGPYATEGSNGKIEQEKGMIWYHWTGDEYGLKRTNMKIRPRFLNS